MNIDSTFEQGSWSIVAYENGHHILFYCYDLFCKYKQDPLIFTKALGVVECYLKRKDYGYSDAEFFESTELILGSSIQQIADWGGRYLYDKNMNWDYDEEENICSDDFSEYSAESSDLIKEFINNLKAFCISSYQVLLRLFTGRDILAINRLSTIKSDKGLFLLIERADGACLELLTTKQDIDFMIEGLTKYKKTYFNKV